MPLFTAKKMTRKHINFTLAKTFLRVENNRMPILGLFLYVLFEFWRLTILALITKWMRILKAGSLID